jgi:hypothetical protein
VRGRRGQGMGQATRKQHGQQMCAASKRRSRRGEREGRPAALPSGGGDPPAQVRVQVTSTEGMANRSSMVNSVGVDTKPAEGSTGRTGRRAAGRDLGTKVGLAGKREGWERPARHNLLQECRGGIQVSSRVGSAERPAGASAASGRQHSGTAAAHR